MGNTQGNMRKANSRLQALSIALIRHYLVGLMSPSGSFFIPKPFVVGIFSKKLLEGLFVDHLEPLQFGKLAKHFRFHELSSGRFSLPSHRYHQKGSDWLRKASGHKLCLPSQCIHKQSFLYPVSVSMHNLPGYRLLVDYKANTNRNYEAKAVTC